MSGHSKWASIKHKKGALDAKRGKTFSKIIRELVTAAKAGGDPNSNARLRTVIDKAKAVNMPQENIKRAIQKGTGELAGTSYSDVTYEGYGSGGVAIIIEGNTDNKNRTAAEMRAIFSKNGGNMGESGSVAWMFEKKGLIVVPASAISEEDLMMLVMDAGADDLKNEGDKYEVITSIESFEKVKKALEEKKITAEDAEIRYLPKTLADADSQTARKVLRLMEALEEHDDVQNVYANFDIPDDVMKEMQEENEK